MIILLAIVLSLHLAGFLLAQSSSQSTPSNPIGIVGLVLIVTCVVRRKNAIGGWLLYFLGYVVLDGLWTIVNVSLSLPTYSPGYWHGNKLYLPFLLATVPPVMIAVVLMLTVIILAQTRDWEWVLRVRLLLAALIIADLIRLGIDYAFFPDNQFMVVARMIVPFLFLSYLFRSERVRRVFLTKDWDHPTVPGYLDSQPRKGIVYTQSELETMRNRSPEQ